ncbi:MAG: hypothetical protein ABII88_03095 [Candidatus Omnitrophota bacterium]
MNALEALKKGFDLVKGLVVVIGIIVIFNCVTSGVVISIVGLNPNPERVGEMAGVMVILSICIMLAWIFMEGGVFCSVLSQIKSGDNGVSGFIGNCLKYFVRLLGIGFVAGLITVVIWFAGALVTGIIVAMGQGTNPFFNTLALILFGIAVIFSALLIMPLLISHYVVVIENGKIIASLKKALGLFKQYWGRFVALFLLITLILLVVSFISNLISVLLTKTIPNAGILAVFQIAIAGVVNGIMSVFSSCCLMSMVLAVMTPQAKEEVVISAA